MGFQPPAGRQRGQETFLKRLNGKRLTVLGDQRDQCVDRRRVQLLVLITQGSYTQQARVLQVGVGVGWFTGLLSHLRRGIDNNLHCDGHLTFKGHIQETEKLLSDLI